MQNALEFITSHFIAQYDEDTPEAILKDVQNSIRTFYSPFLVEDK